MGLQDLPQALDWENASTWRTLCRLHLSDHLSSFQSLMVCLLAMAPEIRYSAKPLLPTCVVL